MTDDKGKDRLKLSTADVEQSPTPSPVVVDVRTVNESFPTPSSIPPRVRQAALATAFVSMAVGVNSSSTTMPRASQEDSSQGSSTGYRDCLDTNPDVYFETIDKKGDTRLCQVKPNEEGDEYSIVGMESKNGDACIPQLEYQPNRDVVLMVRGKAQISAYNSGKVQLNEGKLCIDFKANKGQLTVDKQEGEVAIEISTESGAVVAELQPEKDEKGSRVLRIMALKNNIVIKQEGRSESIVLNQDDQVYLPMSGVDSAKEVKCSISIDGNGQGTANLVFSGIAVAVFMVQRKRKAKN